MANLMVDLETLGPAPKGVILSIGVVAFNDNGYLNGTTFNLYGRDQVRDLGRTVDISTVEFWLRQPKAAQDALFEPKPLSYDKAVERFDDWVREWLLPNDSVWVNGASFDFSILHDFYQSLERPLPWQFRQEKCLRSIRELGDKIALKYSDYKKRQGDKAHSAVDDAMLQMTYLLDVMKKVEEGRDSI